MLRTYSIRPELLLYLLPVLLQEQGKGLEKLAKRFRHDISLIKNGVNTCFGLDGTAAIAKYSASSAALLNGLDKENELGTQAQVSLALAYDLYEAELKQNRCAVCLTCMHAEQCACMQRSGEWGVEKVWVVTWDDGWLLCLRSPQHAVCASYDC